MKALDIARTGPVIPVIVIEDIADAVPLADALVNGGIRVLEITLRTEAALEAIGEIARACPDAIVGAGTLLAPRDVDAVLEKGATFGVSPGSTEALLDAADSAGLPLLPGASTPSEMMRLLDRGTEMMKFFPAEQSGGAPMLKALSSPLPRAMFCPTGGVSPANARDYLSLPNVVCVGGSWVLPKDAIAAKDWPRITKLAAEAAGLRG